MAITINALTTGTGGLETTADASGSFSFQSDGSTIATVTSSGFSVTGTFNAGSLQVGGSDVVVDTDIGSTVPSVSGSGATGTWSVSISGNAATVTNGVYTTGSYANPSWITSLDDGKVLPTMTGNSGKYLTTDGTNSSWATIASSQWTTSGSDIYYNTGNVGIGTSSPTTKLHVSDTGTGILISSSSDTTNTGFSWSDGTISGVLVASGVGGTALYTQSNHPTVFGTNNTERMRIDSSGNVLIGTTGSASSNLVSVNNSGTVGLAAGQFTISASSMLSTPAAYFEKWDNNNTTSNVFVKFIINARNTGSGQINANGALAAAFGSYSDARLKENIEPLPQQLDNILALKPSEFDYKDGSGHQIGFIAQEMQEVYPDVVSEGDEGMLTITGWSKTEARLVKAIQEQQDIIKALETRIQALENQ